jgi:hypothetical protein
MRETTHDKALRIIGTGRIRWDRSEAVYLVVGDSADPMNPLPYVVRLGEEGEPDDCSCVATRTCSHTHAARLIQAVFRKVSPE